MAAGLRESGLFSVVAGGQAALADTEGADLFARRYMLAPADFDTPALRRGLEGLLRQLRSSTAPLAAQFGLADPPEAVAQVVGLELRLITARDAGRHTVATALPPPARRPHASHQAIAARGEGFLAKLRRWLGRG